MNNIKDIRVVFMTALIMLSVAYYAQAKTYDTTGNTTGDNQNQITGTDRPDDTGISDKKCITTGEGTGRIEGYCADTTENLIKAIRTNWEDPEPEVKTNKIQAFITQYSRADSCHNVVNGKCLMASGKPVYEGAVACPYSLKLGSKVKINGKVYTCEDRYAKWLDAKRGLPTFDIFVDRNPHGLYKSEVEIL